MKKTSIIAAIIIIALVSNFATLALMSSAYGSIKDGTSKVMYYDTYCTYYSSSGEYYHTVIETGYFAGYSSVSFTNSYEYILRFRQYDQSSAGGFTVRIESDTFTKQNRYDTITANYYTDNNSYQYCEYIMAYFVFNTNNSNYQSVEDEYALRVRS